MVNVILCRHKLPIQDTAWFSHENDDASVTPYCHYKNNYITLSDDDSWTPVQRVLHEVMCDPDDLPSDQIAIIDDVAHQRCEKQFPQYYCFTTKEEVKVHYKKRKGRSRAYELMSKTMTLRTGCVCASPGFKKR